MKLAVLAETGVVDQQIDLDPFFFGKIKNPFWGIRVGQIRGNDFRADFVAGRQPARKCLEAILSACGENEFRSADRQFFRERHADPGAGSGYEGPFPAPVVHPRLLEFNLRRADRRRLFRYSRNRFDFDEEALAEKPLYLKRRAGGRVRCVYELISNLPQGPQLRDLEDKKF